MAVPLRKPRERDEFEFSLRDFLPAYLYRGYRGRRRLFVNWPVIVALILGYAFGARFGWGV